MPVEPTKYRLSFTDNKDTNSSLLVDYHVTYLYYVADVSCSSALHYIYEVTLRKVSKKTQGMALTSVEAWFYTVASGDLDTVRDNINTYAGARSQNGDTALMVAARYNYSEIVRALAPKEYSLRNHDDYTALFIAIYYDSVASVEILVHYEAYLNVAERLTPLHYAVALNRISCIQPLMTPLGHERDLKGRTSTDLAYLMGHFDAAIFLSIRGYAFTPGVSSPTMIDHMHHFYRIYFEAAFDIPDNE